VDRSTWDARYEAKDLVWGAGPNLFLPPLVDGLAAGTALDVACGEGRNAIWLARQGWEVTAVDFSEVGLDKARTLAGDTVVEWVLADVTTFAPARTFDLVLIFYLHLPEADLGRAFEHAVGAVAPGGTFFGVGHALRNLSDGHGGPTVPEILWTEEMIRPLVTDLTLVELGERPRYVTADDATAIDLVVHATRP
jgi:SAM-dependent methyltransferase